MILDLAAPISSHWFEIHARKGSEFTLERARHSPTTDAPKFPPRATTAFILPSEIENLHFLPVRPNVRPKNK
jgi:hypothetical protein